MRPHGLGPVPQTPHARYMSTIYNRVQRLNMEDAEAFSATLEKYAQRARSRPGEDLVGVLGEGAEVVDDGALEVNRVLGLVRARIRTLKTLRGPKDERDQDLAEGKSVFHGRARELVKRRDALEATLSGTEDEHERRYLDSQIGDLSGQIERQYGLARQFPEHTGEHADIEELVATKRSADRYRGGL